MNAASVRRFALLGSLYFAQGLPFGFFTQVLPLLLHRRGVSLGMIGLSSLLAAPWGLKFLWAPLVDRHFSARFGRRRSWILPLQALSITVLLSLALRGNEAPRTLMLATFLLNCLAATQDIATDGLAVDSLRPEERGLANGLQVAGYRAGMIASGGLLLAFYERIGVRSSFLVLATAMALASVPVLLAKEPAAAPSTPPTEPPPAAPTHFLRRRGSLALLALATTYKFGEAFGTGMLRPFLADAGLTIADIGWLVGTVGFVAGLLGALLGGALVHRLGARRSLLLFGVLQAATVLAYAVVARAPELHSLAIVCGVEHLASGMATAALFTAMMSGCRPGSAATDYTVQASAVVIATGAAQAASGFSAAALGYSYHFLLAAVLSVLALIGVSRRGSGSGADPFASEVTPCV